ncbi:hypothetical protein ACIP9C_16825 [Lysinibacillus sp. NPDC093210]|uniref:hypothetical protein n=1 Tax=Lysinibacillus sp. NPDC093210 TaxID=3364133 RepID=UPI003806F418
MPDEVPDTQTIYRAISNLPSKNLRRPLREQHKSKDDFYDLGPKLSARHSNNSSFLGLIEEDYKNTLYPNLLYRVFAFLHAKIKHSFFQGVSK